VYSVNPDNSRWTVCNKMAWVSSSVFGFGSAISAFGLDRFKKNATKATRGYEFVLEKMFLPVELQPAQCKDKLKDKALAVAQAATAKCKDTAQAAKDKAQAATAKAKDVTISATRTI